MASFGAQTPSTLVAWGDTQLMTFAVDAGSEGDAWNTCYFTIPDSIKEARLISCGIGQSGAAATPLAETLNTRRVAMEVQFKGKTDFRPRLLVSKEACFLVNSYTVPAIWWQFEFLEIKALDLRLGAGDQLWLLMPPVDGSSSPTADYAWHLGLDVLEYFE